MIWYINSCQSSIRYKGGILGKGYSAAVIDLLDERTDIIRRRTPEGALERDWSEIQEGIARLLATDRAKRQREKKILEVPRGLDSERTDLVPAYPIAGSPIYFYDGKKRVYRCVEQGTPATLIDGKTLKSGDSWALLRLLRE
ncbi:hypothetical protein D3C73_17280 [compost metagenome]